MNINKTELLELLEMDGVIELDQYPTKHDCSCVTFVVPKDGKHYQISYERSYNYGIQDNSFEMTEVAPKEVLIKTIVWEEVK